MKNKEDVRIYAKTVSGPTGGVKRATTPTRLFYVRRGRIYMMEEQREEKVIRC